MTAPGTRRQRRSRASVAWWRLTVWVRRHLLHSDGFVLVALSLAAVALGILNQEFPRWFPAATLAVVVLVGGFLLGVRSLLLLDIVVAAVLVWELAPYTGPIPPGPSSWWPRRPRSSCCSRAAAAGWASRAPVATRCSSTSATGLRAHGELPALPDGWSAEVVLRSAGGDAFSGDFLVAGRSHDGRTLEVALVDVSGKGVDAGTRALLLSGAFGGLLGSVSHEDFLLAANRYLLRQEWDEGFATVAHVVIHLETGEYVVSTAGHPPAVQFAAGSGRWRVSEASEGPLLGIFPDAKFVGESGRLDRGDALLLFTDGLIETPGRDLSVGIDKLLGEAERLVTHGFREGAGKLIDRVASAHHDDRAVVLIWRD